MNIASIMVGLRGTFEQRKETAEGIVARSRTGAPDHARIVALYADLLAILAIHQFPAPALVPENVASVDLHRIREPVGE